MFRVQRFIAVFLLPFAFLIACGVISAALSYPVFLMTGGHDVSWLRTLVSRGGQVVMVAGLYPISKFLGSGRSGLPISFEPGKFMIGFGFGVLMLGLHSLLLLVFDIRVLKADFVFDAGRIFKILLNGLTTGVLVALLEETVFRGVMFDLIGKYSGKLAAVLVTAFYYGLVHFLGSRFETPLATVGFDTGFRIAFDAFGNLLKLSPDSFLALFLAGILLGTVRATFRCGLAYCYGIHAGWVFVIKTVKPLTFSVPDSNWAFLVGSYNGFVGYLSSIWTSMLIVFLVLAFGAFKPLLNDPGSFYGRRKDS